MQENLYKNVYFNEKWILRFMYGIFIAFFDKMGPKTLI